MKVFRCIKSYSFFDSEGNGEFPVKIYDGQLFGADNIRDLPGNYRNYYDENYQEVKVVL